MLTGDSIDIHEAHALGMVSKVFPADELATRTLEFARRIAKVPTMAALMIKESVNQTQDNQGFFNSLNACFTLHELNHSHWAEINDDHYPIAKEDSGVPNWKTAPPIVPSLKDKAKGGRTTAVARYASAGHGIVVLRGWSGRCLRGRGIADHVFLHERRNMETPWVSPPPPSRSWIRDRRRDWPFAA